MKSLTAMFGVFPGYAQHFCIFYLQLQIWSSILSFLDIILYCFQTEMFTIDTNMFHIFVWLNLDTWNTILEQRDDLHAS